MRGSMVKGQSLHLRHHLSSDVRRDLYQCCRQWVSAVGSHGTFMGGDSPCLADLVRISDDVSGGGVFRGGIRGCI